MVAYDRYQTKLVKQKWIGAVSHLASQPLDPMALPRKVTVYLSAPPGDGISPTREHFREYVKPLLNAAAVDFDVVEGRKMGELRWKIAESIRKKRRSGQNEDKDPVGDMRKRVGVVSQDLGGIVVVGRHTWKEYLRGVQEGWLGPLEAPPAPSPARGSSLMVGSLEDVVEENTEATAQKEGEAKKAEEKDEIAKPLIEPHAYRNAQIPKDMPEELGPAGIVYLPHLLGVVNTPIRLYRYVTRRHMADQVCREAAATALGVYRPFVAMTVPAGTLMEEDEVKEGLPAEKGMGEVDALKIEEGDWPSRIWKDGRYKGEWTEEVTVDSRVRDRLRRFFIPTYMEPKEGKGAQENGEL
jgi:import inner membrane translocase subunit TIM54